MNDAHKEYVIIDSSGAANVNRLREIFAYRELLFLFVRRDFIAIYRQTLLGPLWFLFQPVCTVMMYYFFFHTVMRLHTGVVPVVLFYLSGITTWSFFSETILKVSDTLLMNAGIFGKVYFPRLVVPLSLILSNLIRFGLQFFIFLIVWIFYVVKGVIVPAWQLLLLFPLTVIGFALLGCGLGLFFSVLTISYRDLRFLLNFTLQLLMFGSAVIYPLSAAPQKFQTLLSLNPYVGLVETLRAGFFNTTNFSFTIFCYSIVMAVFIFIASIKLFSHAEKNFIDRI